MPTNNGGVNNAGVQGSTPTVTFSGRPSTSTPTVTPLRISGEHSSCDDSTIKKWPYKRDDIDFRCKQMEMATSSVKIRLITNGNSSVDIDTTKQKNYVSNSITTDRHLVAAPNIHRINHRTTDTNRRTQVFIVPPTNYTTELSSNRRCYCI